MKKRKIMTITAIALIIVIVSGAVIWKMLGIRAEGESTQIDTSKWDTVNRVNIVYDTAGVPVPVPKGYTASSVDGEHTVNTGFVIYEGTESVTDSNKDTAQKTRNQWVWVPVTNMSDIYFTDSNGKKHGQLWDFSTTGRTKRSYSEGSDYREPDVVTYRDKSTWLPKMLTEEEQITLNKEFQEEFENVIYSIEKYGGFYIGRYETGDLSKQKAKVVKGNTDIAEQKWYTMYRKSKEILQNENGNVRTSMIWGCLWDHTLNWLVASGSKTYSDMKDSTSWGNYYNSTFQYQNSSGDTVTRKQNSYTRIPTGNAEHTKANNIYDMAGNVSDRTLEAYHSYGRVTRGGYCYDGGSDNPASHRGNTYPSDSGYAIRCTCPTLYKVALSPNTDAL